MMAENERERGTRSLGGGGTQGRWGMLRVDRETSTQGGPHTRRVGHGGAEARRRAPQTLPPAVRARANHPDFRFCFRGQEWTSWSSRQLRSVFLAPTPLTPARASKPQKSNQIGRSNLERFHPWGKGGGNEPFFFFFLLNSRFKRDHNLLLSAIPNTGLRVCFILSFFLSCFSEVKCLKN